MPFTFHETLLDCGGGRFLALCLAPAYAPPMPAHKFGYATLHQLEAPPRHLPLGLFTRKLPAPLVRETIERESQRLARAVDSVKERLALSASEISDDFAEAASHAFALSGGRVLLVFGGQVQPHLLRVVSVDDPALCVEETAEALRTRLKVRVPDYMRSANMDAPMVRTHNDDYLLMYLGAGPFVLHLHPQLHRLERADFGTSKQLIKDSFDLQFTQTHAIKHEHDQKHVTAVPLHAPHTPLEIPAKHARAAGYSAACARRAERMALAHPKGVVEILSSDGSAVQTLRPLPAACGKDGAGLALSPDGRTLLMNEDAGTVVVDIDGMRVASVQSQWDLPHHIEVGSKGEAHFHPAWAICDTGLVLLQGQQVSHTPWAALQWQALAAHPAKTPKNAKSSEASAAATAQFAELLGRVMRPALALAVTKKAQRSHLYGTPHLASASDWPQHDGQAMLLLCELWLPDLAANEAALALPATGCLQLYVAVDDELYPLDDGEFAPLAHRTVYCTHPSPQPCPETGEPALKTQFLQLTADKSTYPRGDSIVFEQPLSDEQQQTYFEFMDKHQPDGASAGHRLGGYPHLLQNNDLEARAFEKTKGHYPQTAADQQEAARWQLLLQLDSDDNIMWGTDSGILFIMIHASDLERHDFSKTVALTDGC